MSAPRPRVSICTPAYQAARWLPELLASIWSQDLEDFELVVVDDGSTDATPALLAQQGDPRLRVVRQANQGQVRALSRALALSRGHLIKFADADDVLRPGCLRRMAEALDAHPTAGLVFGRRQILLEDPSDERSRRWAQDWAQLHARFSRLEAINSGAALLDEYLDGRGEGGNWLSEPSGVMVRRACLEQVGAANLRMLQSLDMDLWARVMAHADVAFLDEVVFDYRVTKGGVTAQGLAERRPWLDPLWSLEGLASFPHIRARHPQVDALLRLRQRRALGGLRNAIRARSPVARRMARELADYGRAHAARRLGRPVRLYGPMPSV